MSIKSKMKHSHVLTEQSKILKGENTKPFKADQNEVLEYKLS